MTARLTLPTPTRSGSDSGSGFDSDTHSGRDSDSGPDSGPDFDSGRDYDSGPDSDCGAARSTSDAVKYAYKYRVSYNGLQHWRGAARCTSHCVTVSLGRAVSRTSASVRVTCLASDLFDE